MYRLRICTYSDGHTRISSGPCSRTVATEDEFSLWRKMREVVRDRLYLDHGADYRALERRYWPQIHKSMVSAVRRAGQQ